VHIDWTSLVAVAVVAAAAAVSLVLLVAFALVGLSARSGGHIGGPPRGAGPGTRPTFGRAVAGLCLLTAGLIVCYGIFLIIA
jgi:hypothetical protein